MKNVNASSHRPVNKPVFQRNSRQDQQTLFRSLLVLYFENSSKVGLSCLNYHEIANIKLLSSSSDFLSYPIGIVPWAGASCWSIRPIYPVSVHRFLAGGDEETHYILLRPGQRTLVVLVYTITLWRLPESSNMRKYSFSFFIRRVLTILFLKKFPNSSIVW